MTASDAREAIVTSVEETTVILDCDGQKISWPKKHAPKNVAVGDRLMLALMDVAAYQAKREELAKAILNDILQDNENKEV
ncbi:MAG: hypothetical protein WC497_03165 [Patescibacteria group bacterium]